MQTVASIALECGGKALGCGSRARNDRHRFPAEAFYRPGAEDTDTGWRHRGMNHTWYVTFEVPTDGTLSRRRHPRLTKTFATEAEAKDFARTKFNDGLIVTAGTIIPHLPKRAIPSVEIPAWLELRGQVDPDQ
jgi:hypothetical protein